MMPLSIGVLFIVVGLILININKIKRAKMMLTLGIVWLFLFSYAPFANLLLHTIESNHPTLHTAPKEIKYIYVLGGGHHTDESLPITSQVVEASVVRLNEGIRLYQQLHRDAKIIVSGYHGLYDITEHAIMQQKIGRAHV